MTETFDATKYYHQPLSEMRARFDAALCPRNPPGDELQHLFDFADGCRVGVSVEDGSVFISMTIALDQRREADELARGAYVSRSAAAFNSARRV